jgi:predicted metal-dependent peptidase
MDHPFYGCLALRLVLEEDNNVQTAMTDGRTLKYNTNFINMLDHIELVGVLVHEVNHIVLKHCWRRGQREKMKWNVAADYAINIMMLDAKFTLPEGCLYDEAFRDMAAEEIYAKLPDDDTNVQSGTGKQDPGNCGGVMDAPTQEQAEELEQEWKSAISQAVQVAQGKVPNGLKRYVNQLLNPEVPWTHLLRDFVELTARNDYNWTRPNRRYMGSGIVLPSLLSDELPEVVVAVDTSGSIAAEELNRFAAEISGVLEAYDTKVHVMYCDSAVHKTECFERNDFPIKLSPMGGGGTDFRPVFAEVEKQNLTPCCLIYFTDLWGSFPDRAPEYPVMWVTKETKKKAPFGTTVLFK